MEMESIEKIKAEIDAANDLVWNQRTSPSEVYDPTEIVKGAYEKAYAIDYQHGIARCKLNEGMGAFILDHDYDRSDRLILEARKIFEVEKNEKWIANSYLTQAIIKNSTGQPEAALYLGLKGIDYYESRIADDDYRMACYVVGTIYKDLGRKPEAERYFSAGISIQHQHTGWSARIYAGLSNIKADNGEYDIALSLAHEGLELLRQEDNTTGQSRSLSDIGNIYVKLEKYTDALQHFEESLRIRRKNKHLHFILGSLLDIGKVYILMRQFELAIPIYEEAIDLSIQTNHPGRLSTVYQSLADIYKNQGKFEKSNYYLQAWIDHNQALLAEQREQKVNQSESKLLKEKEDEIERLRNVELKNAYDLIAEKNKEITDSIHYAKRIQKTILADETELSEQLGEHFILFHPKDIVSGDFYWSFKNPETGDFYLAICDSTGHGVPGAFMSLLNTNYLNEALNEKRITDPGKVLDYVRQRLTESISKEGQKDGFDGILLRINKSNRILEYAAANNAPVLVNSTYSELEKDRMPVGFSDQTKKFETRQIPAPENSWLYLYTDGFADQFGGPFGKKFKYKALNELLLSLSQENSAVQHQQLITTFNNWKGNLEQVDDVCILGFRL